MRVGLILGGLLVATNLISVVVLAGDTKPSSDPYPEAHPESTFSHGYTQQDRNEAVAQDLEKLAQRDFAPFVDWRERPYRGDTLTVDVQGDRVTPLPREVSAGGRAVRFFGGSSVFGVGADDASTIPAIYGRLRPAGRVLNHGARGYNTRQTLARLVNVLDQGSPIGTVIFYSGLNDVDSLCRDGARINGQAAESRMHDLLDHTPHARRPSLLGALKTLVYGKTQQLLRPEHHESEETEEPHYVCDSDRRRVRRVARTVLADWRIARVLVRSRGGRFIAILEPSAYLAKPRSDGLARLRDRPDGKQVRAVYSIWQREAARLPWLHDFTRIFDGMEHVFINDANLSPDGNRIVAKRISDIVSGHR